MTDIELRVHGLPAPQGSKRHVGRGILVESSKAVGPWREAVVSEAKRSGIADLRIDAAVTVTVDFLLPRPAGHTGAKGLRPSAPAFPHRKPDIDKLLRSTLDGLVQAGVIFDDARVIALGARKFYADHETAGARIRITTIPNNEQDTP